MVIIIYLFFSFFFYLNYTTSVYIVCVCVCFFSIISHIIYVSKIILYVSVTFRKFIWFCLSTVVFVVWEFRKTRASVKLFPLLCRSFRQRFVNKIILKYVLSVENNEIFLFRIGKNEKMHQCVPMNPNQWNINKIYIIALT